MELRRLTIVAAVLGMAACGGAADTGGGDDTAQAPGDTLTRRQRDSIVSTLPLPGASGIMDARRAADRAAERAEALDSIR
jgi:hypothetical protein